MIVNKQRKNILMVGGNTGIGEACYKRLEFLKVAGYLGDEVDIDRPGIVDLDITSQESIEEFMLRAPYYTHVIYTAGVPRLDWAENLTLEDYVADYMVNVFGFGVLLGEMRKNSDVPFSAVAMVSDAYRNPMRGSATYCSSKAALAALIKNLAREWAPTHRVNGIAPAVVADTPISDYIDATVPDFRGWPAQKAAAYEASLLPMGRRITKDEVAITTLDVLFGPDYLTGSIIEITGGK